MYLAETSGEQQGSGARSGVRAVFISYASQDKATADAICELVENEGIGCWIAPRDVVPGEFYADAIVRALNEAQVLLLVLTEHAVNSPHVLREVERTSSKRHPIISLRIGAISLPPALEYFLSSSHWLEASPSGIKGAFPKLLAAVKRVAAVTPASNPLPGALAPPSTQQPRRGGRSRLLIGLGALAAGILICAIVVRLWGTSHAVSERAAPAAPVPVASARSVAVLPFVDMSEKKDQEYFSDGLSEELIDRLAHAENLKVIARTSSFQFKGKNEDMRTIGQRLGVANLLEGSVRTSGNAIRVTAQLINVADGTHLWLETYDRQSGDIFKIQDEITAAVVAALKATMEAVPGGPDARDSNIESHKKVLLARYFNHRNTEDDSDRALAAIDEAIKIDPQNAIAWTELANIDFVRAVHRWMPPREAYLAARNAIDKALEINPNLAIAHRALGNMEKVFNNDDEAYRRERRRALELDPSLNDFLEQAIDTYQEGNVHEAVQLFRHAADLNPLSTWTLSWYGNALYADGQLKSAQTVMRGILDIQSDIAGTRCPLGLMLLADHSPDAALAIMSKEPDDAERLTCMPAALWSLGRRSEADAMLTQVKEKYPDSAAYGLAARYAARGDKDEAFKWLTRAYDNRDLHLQYLDEDPDLRSLHTDPRFAALVRKRKESR
jgi:TolB-like protein/Flp pilus assembly protein TadD